jgi:Skp family chaperone for outer membrane proteins
MADDLKAERERRRAELERRKAELAAKKAARERGGCVSPPLIDAFFISFF